MTIPDKKVLDRYDHLAVHRRRGQKVGELYRVSAELKHVLEAVQEHWPDACEVENRHYHRMFISGETGKMVAFAWAKGWYGGFRWHYLVFKYQQEPKDFFAK
jgi:hypothetical protein